LAVQVEHYLIVAHAVTDMGNERAQLVPMSCGPRGGRV